jgi:hypothetical protein
MVSMVLYLPGSIWILARAKGWGLDNLANGFAVNVVSRLLPDSNVIFLLDLLPAEASGNFLNSLLLCIQVLSSPGPPLPVFPPVDRWSGQDPIPSRPQNAIDLYQVQSICMYMGRISIWQPTEF